MLSLLIFQNAPFVAQNGGPQLTIDRATGRYAVAWGQGPRVDGAAGEVRLADGRTLRTTDYARHEIATARVRDVLGESLRVTVRHLDAGKPELRQTLWLLKNRPEVVVRLDALDTGGVTGSTPLDAAQATLPGRQSLVVPYDNDSYNRYRSDGEGTSHEVGARYDDGSRQGFVVGSLDHDVWKSGVEFQNAKFPGGVRAFAGMADATTRDKEPHGTVTGAEVRSPRFVLSLYDDWRLGMERYGDLNARIRPPLPWKGGAPFGWNSWAAHMDKLTAADTRVATEFVGGMKTLRNDGTAYVNLDSFWDNLKPAELSAFVQSAHAKGLKAGIYWTPFVAWGGLEAKTGAYTYRDLALKDAKGEPLPKLDGGWPLDPTHPGTLERIDRQLATFVRQGFDFVKLDFMTHGALEARHFDPKVETGTAAYNLGMKRIADDLAPKRIGRPFFISLSIAPLFPQSAAHSRRVSCDAFANIGASEYLMNSVNYGWWAGGRLYRFNDPDHTVVDHARGDKPNSDAEARTRFVASVVGGGMMLNSDDLNDPAAAARVQSLFSNVAALDLARGGKPFLPVDGDTGERAGEAFVRQDGKAAIVAAFNYDKTNAKSRTIPFARLGLKGDWRVRPIVGGAKVAGDGLAFELPPMDCALVRLERTR